MGNLLTTSPNGAFMQKITHLPFFTPYEVRAELDDSRLGDTFARWYPDFAE